MAYANKWDFYFPLYSRFLFIGTFLFGFSCFHLEAFCLRLCCDWLRKEDDFALFSSLLVRSVGARQWQDEKLSEKLEEKFHQKYGIPNYTPVRANHSFNLLEPWHTYSGSVTLTFHSNYPTPYLPWVPSNYHPKWTMSDPMKNPFLLYKLLCDFLMWPWRICNAIGISDIYIVWTYFLAYIINMSDPPYSLFT